MNAKIITISMKHDDCTCFLAEDGARNILVDLHGYMPEVGNLGGDQTILQIDNKTGKILNWEPITNIEIEKLREENDIE
jgi:hypothetical protein